MCHVRLIADPSYTGHSDMGPWYKTEHPGIIPFQGVLCPDGRPIFQCAMSDRFLTNCTLDTWLWEHPGIISFQGIPCPDSQPTFQCAMSHQSPTHHTWDTWIWAPSIRRNTLESSHSRVSHVLTVSPYPSVPCDTSGQHVANGTLESWPLV